MRRIILSTLILLIAGACGRDNQGTLVGVQDRPDWFEADPYGMVFIPMGSYKMGLNSEDVPFAMDAQTKTVTIDPFWMDATEITNNEYRQFVQWVKDSIARQLLAESMPDQFYIQPADGEQPVEPRLLNWEREIQWNNQEQAAILEDLFYDRDDQVYRQKQIDKRKLVFEYKWYDLKQAAKRSNDYNHEEEEYEGYVIDYSAEEGEDRKKPIENRRAFIMEESTHIYPDTLVWMSDYTYSYNEPWARKYFWHPAFDNYPVVGVTWEQAQAFSAWRTKIKNDYRSQNNKPSIEDYRLPTEAEWEYAARGGHSLSKYPWGGPYTRNNKGCFIANFKPMRGDYAADGGTRTLEVASYQPNEYGLYDMAGNVAEWTSSAYNESSYRFIHDLNPDYKYHASKDDPPVLKRKVIRGGSWKDVGYNLQVGVRNYEYKDTAKSYVGFRNVRSYLGRNASNWDSGTGF